MEPPSLRALLVSYVFPPTGGVGASRVLKLAKYLPAHGVRPAVLTAANPSVPLFDESLLRDVAPDLEVIRARTLEPSYQVKQATWTASADRARGLRTRVKRALASAARLALVPDPQLLWQPAVQAQLLARQLSSRRDDVVFLTAPPFSTFLAAPLSRARPGTGVVLDYRDEWITLRTSYEMVSGRLSAALGGRLEAAVLRAAHVVTTATEAFRENLLSTFGFLDPARVRTIPNGFDPDDFPADLPRPPTDRFVVTYAGTVYKLNSPRGLLGAVRRLHQAEPELAKLLRVRFIGRIVDTELEHFAGTEALGVERVGFIEKDRVVRELAASHLLLVIQDEVPGTERIYPAKIFEIMYVGRPCLAITPRGALSDLMARHHLGSVAAPRDEEAIAAALAGALRAFAAGRWQVDTPAVDIDRFHRRAIAGEFADAFRDAVRRARR